jgi:hypothetical protein
VKFNVTMLSSMEQTIKNLKVNGVPCFDGFRMPEGMKDEFAARYTRQ